MRAMCRLPNCFREPRTARRGPCGAVTRPDSRDAERVLCCATQSKIRQATVTVALCRQPEQTEFGGAVLQEDRGRCAHRTTPWGHGQIGLRIESPNAANRDNNSSLLGSRWNVSKYSLLLVGTFLRLTIRKCQHGVERT